MIIFSRKLLYTTGGIYRFTTTAKINTGMQFAEELGARF